MRPSRQGALRAIAICLSIAGAQAVTTSARAESTETRDEAKRLFADGSAKYLSQRYGEALESFRGSYRLVPSPNSSLLIARCLRELGQPTESLETYAKTIADAKKHADEGDRKYAQTVEVAEAESQALRAALGSIRVRHAPDGTRITVGGAAVVAAHGSDAVLWQPPGEASVEITPPRGLAQRQSVNVTAGREVRIEFVAPAPAAVAAPPVATIEPQPWSAPVQSDDAGEGTSSSRPWAVPAAWVSGGVAIVGFSAFVGFGLDSQATLRDLERKCGPSSCGESERAAADDGKRAQTLANVGLAFGLVGVALAATFTVLHLTAPRVKAVAASPGGVVIRF